MFWLAMNQQKKKMLRVVPGWNAVLGLKEKTNAC